MAPRHRFFVRIDLAVGQDVVLDGAQAHHIVRVLRSRPGDTVMLFDGSGDEAVVTLREVKPGRVLGVVSERRRNQSEPATRLTLYQALLPREKMETVLHKATEVGVAAVVPILCERSLVGGDGRLDDRRRERWTRILAEAAEQSGRGRVPVLGAPRTLSRAVIDALATGPALLAWEGERERSLRAVLQSALPWATRPSPTARLGEPDAAGPARALGIFVGPEGGFAAHEVQEARAAGAVVVSLGPRILRAETAGPVMAALVLYEAGELEPCPGASSPS